MLGIGTRGGMMEGADESTELRRHPQRLFFLQLQKNSHINVAGVPDLHEGQRPAVRGSESGRAQVLHRHLQL